MSELFKICKGCLASKHVEEFHRSKLGLLGRCSKCKECRLAYQKIYAIDNQEKVRAQKRSYISAHMKQYQEYQKRYNAENQEKKAISGRVWRLANPEKCAAMWRRRRARKSGAEGMHTAADVRFIFDAQRGLCASCAEKLLKSGKNRYHLDHIIPLARGGSNSKENLQCLCPGCNLRKSSKDPIDWARENGKLL